MSICCCRAAWKYAFADAASALGLFQARADAAPRGDSGLDRIHSVKPGPDNFFWFDIFVVNQDPSGQANLPEDYFYTTFRAGIESIGPSRLASFRVSACLATTLNAVDQPRVTLSLR